jgi:hypothetical protein
MSNYILVNNLSAEPPNANIGYCNSWFEVKNNLSRPLYAQASFITNFDDLSISLSANDVNIGSIHISDHTTELKADVVDVGSGSGALRVISQDLESTEDDVTVGDRLGNFAAIHQPSSALKVYTTNPVSTVNILMKETQLDAFGRLRVSTPLTLFDSSHRYKDNNLWTSLTSVGGSVSFNQNQGLVDLSVNSSSGSSVIRETTKVFSYQPGKSLLVLNTFVMAQSATNLRQRVGYFGNDNGIYFQMDDNVLSFVKRTLVNGLPISDNVIPRSSWNGDKLDGTGPSGLTLDITKSQILWMDIEWLGVGTVRTGFIIDGKYILCHSFHHANQLASTYITTASLPLRYEITNKGNTNGSKTLKQICSSVISEGGYELRGLQQAIETPITAPKTLSSKGVFYPAVTIRLKSNRRDAVVIITALSVLGKSIGYYNWKVIASGTTSGGSDTWISAGDDSAVEYKLDATSISGGRVLASGFLTTSNQGSTQIDILKEALFKFQLERDGLNSTNYEISLVVASDSDTRDVFASMDWEEITR